MRLSRCRLRSRAAIAVLAIPLAWGCERGPVSADSGREAALVWATRESVPFSPEALAGMAGRARMLALGEAAHGDDETLEQRNDIFRHLVREAGFTAIALETGFAESLRLADFIAGGPGDARAVARASFTSGFGNFKANAELLEWMRAYNASVPASARLRIIGVDLSLGGPLGSWATPAPVDCALDALAAHGSRDWAVLRQAFDDELRSALTRQTPLTAAEQDRYAAFTRRLAGAVEATRDDNAVRCAVVAEQAGEVSRVTPAPSAGGISPSAWRALEARDLAMADNALWALRQLPGGSRLLVFAHNAHVMNEPQRGSHLRMLAQPPRSMGQRLREALGTDLAIVAEAAPRARTGAIPGELGDAFRSAVTGPRLIDLRSAPPQARGWLLLPHRLRANVDSDAGVTPATAFDIVLLR
jgi:erythromycin esterase